MNPVQVKILAICLYGDNNLNVTTAKSLCLDRYKKFNNFDIVFFEKYDEIKFKALWLCSFEKDKYELENKMIFDACLAIDIDYYQLIEETPILSAIEDKLYYTTGFYIRYANISGANPCIFYANSLLFNRACEFYLNNIESKFLTDERLESKFYFHLKSYNIQLECINYENWNLFKRSTQNHQYHLS